MLVKIDVGRLHKRHASGLLPISTLGQEETSYTLSWCNATHLELISPSHPLALAVLLEQDAGPLVTTQGKVLFPELHW